MDSSSSSVSTATGSSEEPPKSEAIAAPSTTTTTVATPAPTNANASANVNHPNPSPATTPIPRISTPQHNNFHDISFCIAGAVNPKLIKILESGGAKQRAYAGVGVTHYIVGAGADDVVIEEVKEVFEIPIVSSRWITYSALLQKPLPIHGFSGESCQIFAGTTVTAAGIKGQDLKKLWANLTYHGGLFSKNLTSKTTHLVTNSSSGTRFKIAQEKGIRVVSLDWISDSISKGKMQETKGYHPSLLIGQQPQYIPPSPIPVRPLQQPQQQQQQQVAIPAPVPTPVTVTTTSQQPVSATIPMTVPVPTTQQQQPVPITQQQQPVPITQQQQPVRMPMHQQQQQQPTRISIQPQQAVVTVPTQQQQQQMSVQQQQTNVPGQIQIQRHEVPIQVQQSMQQQQAVLHIQQQQQTPTPIQQQIPTQQNQITQQQQIPIQVQQQTAQTHNVPMQLHQQPPTSVPMPMTQQPQQQVRPEAQAQGQPPPLLQQQHQQQLQRPPGTPGPMIGAPRPASVGQNWTQQQQVEIIRQIQNDPQIKQEWAQMDHPQRTLLIQKLAQKNRENHLRREMMIRQQMMNAQAQHQQQQRHGLNIGSPVGAGPGPQQPQQQQVQIQVQMQSPQGPGPQQPGLPQQQQQQQQQHLQLAQNRPQYIQHAQYAQVQQQGQVGQVQIMGQQQQQRPQQLQQTGAKPMFVGPGQNQAQGQGHQLFSPPMPIQGQGTPILEQQQIPMSPQVHQQQQPHTPVFQSEAQVQQQRFFQSPQGQELLQLQAQPPGRQITIRQEMIRGGPGQQQQMYSAVGTPQQFNPQQQQRMGVRHAAIYVQQQQQPDQQQQQQQHRIILHQQQPGQQIPGGVEQQKQQLQLQIRPQVGQQQQQWVAQQHQQQHPSSPAQVQGQIHQQTPPLVPNQQQQQQVAATSVMTMNVGQWSPGAAGTSPGLRPSTPGGNLVYTTNQHNLPFVVNSKTKTALANLLSTRLMGTSGPETSGQQQQQMIPASSQQQQGQSQSHPTTPTTPNAAQIHHAINVSPPTTSGPIVAATIPASPNHVLQQQQQQQIQGQGQNVNMIPMERRTLTEIKMNAAVVGKTQQQQQQQIQLQSNSQGPGIVQHQLQQQQQQQVLNTRTQFYGHDPNIKLPPDGFLLGCIFWAAQPIEDKNLNWEKCIEQYGGEVEKNYCPRLTHVICSTQRFPEFVQAIREGKRLVTLHWLSDICLRKCVASPFYALHLPVSLPRGERPLEGERVAVTGFVDEDRTRVKIMCSILGAVVTPFFTRMNMALVAHKPEGPKFQKAREWRKPVVNVQFLNELMFGQIISTQMMHSPKYQHFNLEQPFRCDIGLVSQLMAAWKVPIRVGTESFEKYRYRKRALSEGVKEESEHSKRRKLFEAEHEKFNSYLNAEIGMLNNSSEPSGFPVPIITMSGFARVYKDKMKENIERLGGKFTEDVYLATHLITRPSCRTKKLFIAFSRVSYIVSSVWIYESLAQGKFLNVEKYTLEDSQFENSFGFSFASILASPERRILFAGLTFYITPSVAPSRQAIKEIVESAGGQVDSAQNSLKSIKSLASATKNYVLITCPEDSHLLAHMTEDNDKDKDGNEGQDTSGGKITLYSPDDIFLSIIQQRHVFV